MVGHWAAFSESALIEDLPAWSSCSAIGTYDKWVVHFN